MKIAMIVMQRGNSNNNLGSCSWHVFVHISGTRTNLYLRHANASIK